MAAKATTTAGNLRSLPMADSSPFVAANNLVQNRCTAANVQVFVRDRLDEKTKCASVGPKNVEETATASIQRFQLTVRWWRSSPIPITSSSKDTNGLRDIFSYVNSTSKSKERSSFTIIFDLLQTGDITVTVK
jgi:hypothetical protein